MQSIAQLIDTMERRQETIDEDEKLLSSASLMRDFLESVMWQDISGQMAQFLVTYRNELETAGKTESIGMEDVAFTQGVCFALRTLSALPKTLLQHLEIEEQKGQEESDG